MKRFARVLLAVLALAVATASFAQAQQWEYASLWIPNRFGGGIFESSRERIVGASNWDFMVQFVRLYGFPSSLYDGASGEMAFLNIIGSAGWELVTTRTDEDGWIHLFKRPLP